MKEGSGQTPVSHNSDIVTNPELAQRMLSVERKSMDIWGFCFRITSGAIFEQRLSCNFWELIKYRNG